jgi:subtilisin family serine protease
MKKNNTFSLLPYIREDIFGFTPKDPETYGWEIKKFKIPEKWIRSMGEGVTVAVIDTGVDFNHEDLKNNILEGKNFISPKKDPMDFCGHGTHVASTIAAEKNGKGIVGVAPKTKIVPIKALDDNGNGKLENILKAIEWSGNLGVNFITMSLGSNQNNKDLYNVINYANSKNCVVFCAAGNSGKNEEIMIPARYDNTISIGAVDKNLERTEFTCSGESLDFLAPGHDIMGCVPNNKYALMSGTSMSNPFAVGCASLALSFYKKQKSFDISKNLQSYKDYISLFKKNAISLKNSMHSNKKRYQGYGIINPI